MPFLVLGCLQFPPIYDCRHPMLCVLCKLTHMWERVFLTPFPKEITDSSKCISIPSTTKSTYLCWVCMHMHLCVCLCVCLKGILISVLWKNRTDRMYIYACAHTHTWKGFVRLPYRVWCGPANNAIAIHIGEMESLVIRCTVLGLDVSAVSAWCWRPGGFLRMAGPQPILESWRSGFSYWWSSFHQEERWRFQQDWEPSGKVFSLCSFVCSAIRGCGPYLVQVFLFQIMWLRKSFTGVPSGFQMKIKIITTGEVKHRSCSSWGPELN